MDGVEVVPPSQSTICWNGIQERTMKKCKNLGCNQGPRMMVIVLVVLILCWGRGEWKTSGGDGSNFHLHLICDTEFLYCYAAGILVVCNEEKCGRLRGQQYVAVLLVVVVQQSVVLLKKKFILIYCLQHVVLHNSHSFDGTSFFSTCNSLQIEQRPEP